MMTAMIKSPMTYLARLGSGLLAAGLIVTGLAAQADDTALRQSGSSTVLIKGGTVHTMGEAGRLNPGDVLIENGKILAVAASVTPPSGTRVIDASGKIVTPGLMTSYSSLGLLEVSAVGESRDDRTPSSYRKAAELDVRYALNPASTLIPVTRLEGITRAITTLRGGDLIAGQGAAIHLGDGPDMITDIHVGIFADMTPDWRGTESRAVKWAKLLDAVKRAKSQRAEDNGAMPLQEFGHGHLDEEQAAFALTLEPVIKGEQPLIIEVNRASDIRSALRLAEEQDLDIILLRAREAWQVADEIAAAGVPVILNPLDNLPSRFESIGSRLDNAARLQQAGILIAFSVFDTHQERLLPQLAGNAVANGLPYPAALKAMTINPAKIFGIDERYGSLETGKDADVVIWDGDPMEVTSSPDMVFIKGVPQPMESRQTKLRDRYKNLNRGPLPLQYR